MIIRLICIILCITACSKAPEDSFTPGCFRKNESILQFKIVTENTTDLHVILNKLDQIDGYLSSSYDPLNKIVKIKYNNALARNINYVRLFEQAEYQLRY
jgi:predicted Fe-S protein YdhL (DUF1289 family)